MKRFPLLTYPYIRTDSDHTGAGFILQSPDESSVLLIKDDRSMKWSFPKGRKEDYDITLIHTAVRECAEETGLYYGVDYTTVSSEVYTFGRAKHIFFLAKAYHTKLPPIKTTEHVVEIRYVPLTEIEELDTNLYVRLWIAKKNDTSDTID